MTLAEWVEQSGITPQKVAGGTWIPIGYGHPHLKALWTLTDYAVSSVGGTGIWVVPKNGGEPTP